MKFFKYLLLFIIVSVITSCLQVSSTKSILKFNNTPSNLIYSAASRQQSINAFKTTVYPLITKMTCVDCHGDAKKYQPYYAVSDVAQAWQTILVDAKKINLETPEASRIYLRLKNDHHNCLDCDQEAAVILSAIKKWKELVKADSGSAIKTDLLYFKNTVLINPEAEYGTILFEAEQDNFPQAMTGRFVSADDGKASGFKYALTPTPFGNPTKLPVVGCLLWYTNGK